MTREQKIKQLIESRKNLEIEHLTKQEVAENELKIGFLAGIDLRDAELLDRLGKIGKFKSNPQHDQGTHIRARAFYDGQKAQHEQMLKAIKGDGNVD